MGYDEKFIEDMRKRQLGLDDIFQFSCLESCKGQCCKNNDTIILNPFDIFRIAKHFNQPISEVIKDNCEYYHGSDSRLPIMSIRRRTGDGSCRFLRMGKCTLHGTCKPISCRIYPLGRYHMPGSDEGYMYFLQQITCGGKETQTVRDWIDADTIGEIDRMSLAWGKAVLELSTYLRSINNPEHLKMAQRAVMIATYVSYDTDIDFVEQLEGNLDKLQLVLPGFKRGK
ncbi:hypothetical protein SAMN02745136_00445 [Anaerocolumna jejuensis DSM 15929]|uniref:Uncharacterized protein n=1 Tax=Anaerocolumna jejuensis DSM 15929 TaxID=1121322 RepID=A0A1M6KGM1_9FIRM|nr:hypothetical protein [Anaerocolumna jejuensis]SHJ58061.1 hypothetical protein SAMN02745136_00445 [Anaerocolumna jejuensis DSM 15929]